MIKSPTASSNRDRRFGLRVLLVVLALILMSLFVRSVMSAFGFGANEKDFVTFRQSVITNVNFVKVISWSDSLLLSTAQGLQTNIQVPQEEIPVEVKTLFWKQSPEPYISVSVHTNFQLRSKEAFVSVNYMFRDVRYGFFIGSSNLDIPDGKVKCIWKYRDGIYCFKDY